jgi:glutaredoxin
MTRITLVGRAGCHLCDAAREVVARVADDTGAGWAEVDVDTAADLDDAVRARWSEQVPVVLVDGEQHDFWRVDEQRLRDALDPARRRPWQRRRAPG